MNAYEEEKQGGFPLSLSLFFLKKNIEERERERERERRKRERENGGDG